MTSFFGIPPVTVAEWMAAAVGTILLVLGLFALANRILLRMAVRNIPRRRAQSVLILFGVMLATLIITASLAVGDTSTYSLESIQVRQMAGIDAAFTRLGTREVQGAGITDADFFTEEQASSVVDIAKSDANVAATSGAIATPGSMLDVTTGQTSAENVAIFGVGNDFASVWGALHSRSGGLLDVAGLSPTDVIIGSSLADHLDAKIGDQLQLYVAGHAVDTTIRGILDTEVNPSIANHGPIVNSVVLPLSEVRSLLNRPTGYNVVFVHFKGAGGLDDLGTNGVTGDEVTRHVRSALADRQSAAELFSYLATQAIIAQVQKIHDAASFLDPDKDTSQRLLVELRKSAPSDEFKSLVADRFADRILDEAVIQASPPADMQQVRDDLHARLAALYVDSAAATDMKKLLLEPAVNAALQSAGQQGLTTLLAQAQQPGLTPEFKATVGSPDVQKSLHDLVAAGAPQQLEAFNAIAARLDISEFQSYKADAVTFALQGGIVITGALLAVSFFSLCVGVLLIFLIFVMLAAERRAEMGMSRAVGLKRRHLTQMFLFEGMAYTLGATVIGVALGVVVGFLMIGVLSTIFSGFYPGFTLTYHVEWTSLVIAACLGILLTFAVVAVSAYRVSRLNIVAAIRDLDESE
ncbi:MAG TPA: FtsX-like permease family protein, partial [Candidatus Dormibacteraeota bacterium]|nr:FtsX-like permease family protein [Candidatus Dormibacteraeota bacterium]